ncbi:MAG: hypothetical protein ACM3WV_06260 [Bacillota bacterium]
MADADNHVFDCPRCKQETPHQIVHKRGGLLGVSCLNCQTVSLVKKEVFHYYQEQWEEQLKELLSKLEKDNRPTTDD